MLFFVKSAEKQKRVKFRLDFLIKQRKVGIWFIICLRQNVYKSILLFPKTILFLAMLLVCGRCHLHWRMDMYMCSITSLQYMLTLENQKSYNNIQTSRILFSWMCKKPWGTHTKNTGNRLERSLVSFRIRSQMHRCYSKCESLSIERHCSWPIRIDRDYLIIFTFTFYVL